MSQCKQVQLLQKRIEQLHQSINDLVQENYELRKFLGEIAKNTKNAGQKH